MIVHTFSISGTVWSWWLCLCTCRASNTTPSGTVMPSLFSLFSAKRSVLKASSGILPPNDGSTCSLNICRFCYKYIKIFSCVYFSHILVNRLINHSSYFTFFAFTHVGKNRAISARYNQVPIVLIVLTVSLIFYTNVFEHISFMHSRFWNAYAK